MAKKKLIPEYGFTLGNDADIKGGIISQILDNVDQNKKEIYSKLLSSFATSQGITLQDVARNFIRKNADDSVTGKLTFAQEIKSDNYADGALGQGWKLYKDVFGDGILEIDKVNVRKELITNLLTYEKINAIGGTLLLSAAWCTVAKTLVTTSGGTPIVRIFFKPDGIINNPWFVNDNVWVKSGIDKFLMSYVIGATYALDSDGFYHIDVYYNKTSFNSTLQLGTYLPNVGDVVVQHGHRGAGNDYRKNIIIISIGGGTDEYPYIEQYTDVTGFSREGKLITRISDDVYFGDADKSKYIWWNKDGLGNFLLCGTLTQTQPTDSGFPTPSFKGAWINTTEYFRGDVVTYEGSTWIMYSTISSTGDAPYNGSSKWLIYAAKGDDGIGEKGDPGENGQSLTISATSQVFSIYKDGTNSPSQITITANGQFLPGLPSFSVTWGTATLTANDDYSKILTFQNMSSDFVIITVSWGGLTDTISIAKLKDGESSLNVLLSNESHNIPCDADGSNPNFIGSWTTIGVYYGVEHLEYEQGTGYPTTNGKYTVTFDTSNVTSGSTSGYLDSYLGDASIINLTSMTDDTGSIDYSIRARVANKNITPAVVKRQTFSKNKQGYVGKAVRYTNWKVGVDYYDGELSIDNPDKYLDYVTYKDIGNRVRAYKCTLNHTSSLSNAPDAVGSLWDEINYVPVIASNLVLANQAVIGGFAFSEAVTPLGGAIAPADQFMQTTDSYTNPAIKLKGDGSGHFAKGKIKWSTDGKAEYEGELTTRTAQIGDFNIALGKILSSGLEISDTSIEDISTLQTDTSTTAVSRPSPDTWNNSQSGTTNNAHAYTQPFTAPATGILKFVCTIEPDIDADDYGWLVIVKDSNDNITFVKSARGLALSGKIFEVPVIYNVTYTIHAYSTGSFLVGETYTTTASISGESGNANNIVIYNQVPKTKIGNNGIYSFFDDDKYMYFNANYGFEVRFGNYGIRITSAGAKKTSDGFSTVSNL